MLLQHAVALAAAPDQLFDFLVRPSNLLELSPAELNLQLLAGPERLTLGSTTTWKVRRWGIAQQWTHAVAALEENGLLVQEQQQGPFRAFRHEQRLIQVVGGTRLEDRLDILPPGGLLGLVLTEQRIAQDVHGLLDHRDAKLRDKFGAGVELGKRLG